MKIIRRNAMVAVISAALVVSSAAAPAWAAETKKPVPVEDPGLTDQASAYVRDYLSDHRRAGSLAGSILGGALLAHPAGPILGSLLGFFIGKQTMFDEDKTREQKAQSLLARRDIVPKDGDGQGIPTLSFASAQGVKFEDPPSGSDNTVVATTAPALASVMAPPLPAAVAMAATPPAPPAVAMAATPPAPPAVKVAAIPPTPIGVAAVPPPPAAVAPPAPVAVAVASPVPAAIPDPVPLPSQLPIPMGAPTTQFSRQQIAAMCGSGRAIIDPRLNSLCFYFQGDWPADRGSARPNVSLATP